jgi:DNA-binding transcriptional ArsR family regulator
MKELEKNFKALANRRRLAILKYLKLNDEATVAEIAENIDLSFKATSKHLGILLAIDIVENEQRSLQVFYSIAKPLHPVIKHLLSIL